MHGQQTEHYREQPTPLHRPSFTCQGTYVTISVCVHIIITSCSGFQTGNNGYEAINVKETLGPGFPKISPKWGFFSNWFMALAPFGSSVSHFRKLLELLIRTLPLSTLRTPNWIKLTVLLNFVLLIPNIYIEYKQDLISSVYNNKSVITVIFRLFFWLGTRCRKPI